MASPKKLLVLDLGMQSMRLAEFSTTREGILSLVRGARREFLLDPALDTSRPEQTRIAIQEILKEWKLKSADVSCVLPSHMVFTRVVPLDVPRGAGGQVEAVVRFEAQQNIPFPLEEVVWDYAVMGETPAGAVNVVFVAVKADLLETVCHAISSTGLNILAVTVAPMALYNAYRHAYPETIDSTTLLLDVGSRTTNLVITKSGSFFSRSIPSGGLAVTLAIAKDIHAQIEEAEHLKVTRGSVSLGPGFQPPADPVEANLARIARQTLLKTQADIMRSISYYRSTLGGMEPDHIMLTGGMAAMPYMAEFLKEKLQKEVSFFNPIKEIPIGEISHSAAGSFLESNHNNLGELVGGALEINSSHSTPISLLPPSISRKRAFAKRIPALSAAILIFLASLTAWYLFALKAAAGTREETAKLNSAISSEETVSREMDSLQAEMSSLQNTENSLLSVIQLRDAYPGILAELSAKIPDRFLWITEIQPVGDLPQRGVPQKAGDTVIKAISVKGLYLDNPRQAAVIDDFVTSLQSSTIFAVEEQSKSKIITQRGSPNGDYWAYPFSLRIPLRSPITPLP
jgi:type IV pilus assembly protein PilM